MIQPGSRFERFFRWVAGRKFHYTTCFNTPSGRAVLLDLAPYCFAAAACKNDREQGRRDVWLRIQQMLHMNEEELAALSANLSAEQRHQLWNPSKTYLEE